MGIGTSAGRVKEQLELLTSDKIWDGKKKGEEDYWFGNRELKDLEQLLGGTLADSLCKRMVTNNPQTKNLQRFIKHTILLLQKFQQQQTHASPHFDISSAAASQINNATARDCVRELNVVYILRVFIKYLIERAGPRELEMYFDDEGLTDSDAPSTTTSTTSTTTPAPTTDASSHSTSESEGVTVVVVGEGSHQVEEIKKSTSEQPNLMITVQPKGPVSLTALFLQTLMDFCIDTEITFYTYDLHKEIGTLLVVLFSTQLYRSLPLVERHDAPTTEGEKEREEEGSKEERDKGKEKEKEGEVEEKEKERKEKESSINIKEGDNLFLDTAQGYYRIAEFVKHMLANFVERRERPSRHQPGSLLNTIGTAASQLLFLPLNAYSYFFEDDIQTAPNPKVERSLADLSILMVLVLSHCTLSAFQGYASNPYRKQLSLLQDLYEHEDHHEGGPPMAVMRISFKNLYEVFCTTMTEDSSIILLYLLFHGNPHFLAYVLSRTDYDTLLLPMLSVLYSSIEERPIPKRVYMILICLLILSQDTSFNENIQKLIVPSANWFKERFLHDISVGSLISIILIRTVHLNINHRLRDTYLHLNCLATLANMSTSMEDMHPYAAHRFVKLFEMVSRKHGRLIRKCQATLSATPPPHTVEHSEGEAQNNSNSINGSNETAEPPLSEPEMDLMIAESFLYIVLEILNSCLTNALRKNPQLSYALLQEKGLFPPHRNNPRFQPLVLNIEALLDHFESMLNSSGATEWTTSDILAIIEKGSMTWKTQKYPLQFTYDEEEHAEKFFTPYTWEVVRTRLHTIRWSAINMKLFEDAEKERKNLVQDDDELVSPREDLRKVA